MRVHELAKELNTTSKDLIEKVKKELDKDLKSHSSEVAPGMVDRIKKLYVDFKMKATSILNQVDEFLEENKQRLNEKDYEIRITKVIDEMAMILGMNKKSKNSMILPLQPHILML